MKILTIVSMFLMLASAEATYAIQPQKGEKASDKNSPSLLTIDGKQVTRAEFERVYRKNNTKDAVFDKKSLDEYLELYINYKLKVREAEEMKLDTAESFRNELAGYRKQLAQPYLIDKEVTEQLIREAYDRLKTEVNTSHILIKVDPDALPSDTMKAYNRAMKIREMISKGADFAKTARDSSEDPSAKDNGGDLGYFTSMQMVYPFETAAYKAKAGELTMPVRTRFGFHILKVHAKRPAQGEITVAHIMIKSAKDIPAADSVAAKLKVDEIYNQLLAGANFEEIARTKSEDPGSARNGGILPPFGTGKMVPEFEKVAFGLKSNGDISAPLKSAYGWHIIKRLEKKDIPNFEDIQSEIKNRISRDSRADITRSVMLGKIKNQYGFKEVPNVKSDFYKVIDSTLIEGEWEVKKAAGLTKTLFTIAGIPYTQQHFATFVGANQVKKKNSTPRFYLDILYNQFVDESLMAFRDSRLEEEFPEYKALMEEYRDGILLFELTDKKVWSRAMKDSAGLAEFHKNNEKKYMWGDRLDASIYSFPTEEIGGKIRKMIKKGASDEEIVKKINANNMFLVSINKYLYSRGDNEMIDSIKWTPGLTNNFKHANNFVFVNVRKVAAPSPKTLEEAKGLVTSDYQAFLEKEWIESLRKKYKVEVNREVLSSIIQ